MNEMQTIRHEKIFANCAWEPVEKWFRNLGRNSIVRQLANTRRLLSPLKRLKSSQLSYFSIFDLPLQTIYVMKAHFVPFLHRFDNRQPLNVCSVIVWQLFMCLLLEIQLNAVRNQ